MAENYDNEVKEKNPNAPRRVLRKTSFGCLVVLIWPDGHMSGEISIREDLRKTEDFVNYGNLPIYDGDDGSFQAFVKSVFPEKG